MPVLELRALDADGNPIDGVEVSTAFGSDRGSLLVPAHSAVLDILRFRGRGVGRVADVEATVSDLTTQAGVEVAYPEVEYLDDSGAAVAGPWEAASFRVTNPGEGDYAVGLVGIVWAQPKQGRPQQWQRLVPLADAVDVPAGGRVEIPTKPSARGRIGSAKAFLAAG